MTIVELGLFIATLSALISVFKDMHWANPLFSKTFFVKNSAYIVLILLAVTGCVIGLIGLADQNQKSSDQEQTIDNLEKSNQDMRALLLLGNASKPEVYFYVEKSGSRHSLDKKQNEQSLMEPKRAKRHIGFSPQSVRDVLLPGSKNVAEDAGGNFGYMSILLDRYQDQIFFTKRGFIDVLSGSVDEWVETFEVNFNNEEDHFAISLEFNKEWSWGAIYESISKRYELNEPVLVFEKFGMEKAVDPEFEVVQLTYILNARPTIRITVPLEVKNVLYDHDSKSARYELHASAAPELVTLSSNL